jgi:hypothetical protein
MPQGTACSRQRFQLGILYGVFYDDLCSAFQQAIVALMLFKVIW